MTPAAKAKHCRNESGDTLPLSRFRDKVRALKSDEPLQLVYGDLPAIARAVGRSPSHVLRVIRGDTARGTALLDDIAAVVGVPVDRIRLLNTTQREAAS